MAGNFYDDEDYSLEFYSKPSRMRKREEFVTLTKKGDRVITKGLVLQCAGTHSKDISLKEPKLGFTASKKVGGAVIRNRSKRRLKEASRELYKNHPKLFKKGYSYNFIARYSTAERPFGNLVRDMKFALHNIKDVCVEEN